MLSQADAELVRHDPTIPGLRLLLDPVAFARKVKELWPQLQLEKIEPQWLRYEAGQWCLASFRLTTPATTIRIYAKAYNRDAGIKLMQAKTDNHYAAGDGGMSARILSDFGVIIYAFPNDGQLVALAHIRDPDRRYDLLRSLLPTQPGWWHGALELIRYRPEETLVARLNVAGQPRAIIKLLSPEDYLLTGEQPQYRQPPAQEGVATAELIGTSEEHHARAYTYLKGVHLNKLLNSDEQYADKGVERAAEALASLHRRSIADFSELTIKSRADEIEEIRTQASRLRHLSPHLKAPATQLADVLIEQLQRYPEARVLSHGHFIDRHILIGNQTTGIADLDQMYIGDANSDIGYFIAHLERHVLRGKLTASQAKKYKGTFLHAYGKTSPERVELYTAIGLFKMASNPFQHREAEWLQQISALLKRARRIMININENDLINAATAFHY